MAYDLNLAARIRDGLDGTPDLTEKKMFGGIGWMIGGNMACGCHNDGQMMVRCSKENHEAYAADAGAGALQRGGKGMVGWILVNQETVATDEGLSKWIGRGKAFASALPPKKKKK